MITEDYVSFETAKLLKEKGFDEPTVALYINETLCVLGRLKLYGRTDLCIKAPTLQMAVKWLREVHHIHITLKYCYSTDTYETVINLKKYICIVACKNTFEKATEAALKYCLENLI